MRERPINQAVALVGGLILCSIGLIISCETVLPPPKPDKPVIVPDEPTPEPVPLDFPWPKPTIQETSRYGTLRYS